MAEAEDLLGNHLVGLELVPSFLGPQEVGRKGRGEVEEALARLIESAVIWDRIVVEHCRQGAPADSPALATALAQRNHAAFELDLLGYSLADSRQAGKAIMVYREGLRLREAFLSHPPLDQALLVYQIGLIDELAITLIQAADGDREEGRELVLKAQQMMQELDRANPMLDDHTTRLQEKIRADITAHLAEFGI
jgi:hypothetical protein